MNKMSIHLWFDKEASEAADFYISLFENSVMHGKTILNETPSGTVEMVTITLEGTPFMLLSAGPYFKINPSVSFMIACTSNEEVNYFWNKLIDNGEALMPLESYPFSPLYGWVIDKFGVSWQVMHVGDAPIKSKITPSLMFVGDQCGRAEEAVKFYGKTFKNSNIGDFSRYGEGQAPNEPDYVNYVDFNLEGMRFSAMDSGYEHDFSFNEAISFIITCASQEEIDYYWEALSAVPEAEQCGWIKDRYGVSWQITPARMDEMMRDGTPEQLDRVTQAFLKMKKFDVAELEKAYRGETSM